MRLDEQLLREEIRKMNSRQKLFQILREELSALGYWKNKARGDPAKGYSIAKMSKKLRIDL